MIIYLIGSVSLDSDYRATFARAERLVRKAIPDGDVINPGNRSGGLLNREYIALSLRAVDAAGAVVCTWTADRSAGAAWELGLAKLRGKKIGRVSQDGIVVLFSPGDPAYAWVAAGESIYPFAHKEEEESIWPRK